MKLGEFIKKFIRPNSLIRLVYKTNEGHEIALESWEDVSMEWEVLKGKGKNRHFIDNEVIGITCISGMNRYSEAINIVIEKMDKQTFVDEVVFNSSNQITDNEYRGLLKALYPKYRRTKR